MRRSRPFLAVAALLALLVALPAGAAFHLFTINEAYSNASGTVQYVELTALAGGQQFTQGHTLVSSAPGQPTRTFNLASNLPGDTSGRTMLFGTAGMQAAFGVTPDYIIPDGFLHTIAGTINWGEGSDVWSHPALPTNGASSLNRNGTEEAATPRNFSGGVINATVQALYWAFPAGSETGWGVNITHQANTLFATWFTYDTDGSGMWLVMSNGDPIGSNVYSGPLYRTTGPAFSNFPPNATIGLTQVGTATFAFSGPARAVFSYTVNGISQSKEIVRQEFSGPVPFCTPGGNRTGPRNYQDLWWRSPAGQESGWGLNITHQGDILFGTWFTYGADGRGMWLVMPDATRTPGTETYTGPLYRTRGNPFNSVPWNNNATVVGAPVGSATLTFSDNNNGTFTYTVDGVTQSKPITRQVYASPTSLCLTFP